MEEIEQPYMNDQLVAIDKPIIYRYPPGNPNDLIIIQFRFPKVTSTKGRQVDDTRSGTLLDIVHEPIGHLLSKRRIALYLELFYPEINVTLNLVEKCYNVFRLVCQKSNFTDCVVEDSLDFSFSSGYTNPSTFVERRDVVIKDLLSKRNPTFSAYDTNYKINTHLEMDKDGKWIRNDCDLLKILSNVDTYKYFIKVWSSFPDLQSIYNALRIGFPSGVCCMILRYSTFGKKDNSELPEVDPQVFLVELEKDDDWLAPYM